MGKAIRVAFVCALAVCASASMVLAQSRNRAMSIEVNAAMAKHQGGIGDEHGLGFGAGLSVPISQTWSVYGMLQYMRYRMYADPYLQNYLIERDLSLGLRHLLPSVGQLTPWLQAGGYRAWPYFLQQGSGREDTWPYEPGAGYEFGAGVQYHIASELEMTSTLLYHSAHEYLARDRPYVEAGQIRASMGIKILFPARRGAD